VTEFMTVRRFASKVGWEGGVVDALDYGLHATDLNPGDEGSKPLREAWAALEDGYRDFRPLLERVSAIIDDLDEDGRVGDADEEDEG
jgi:hypothetical protein